MTNQYFNSNNFIIKTMFVQFIFITFNAVFHFEEMTIETEKIKSIKNVFIKSVILNELKKPQFNKYYDFKLWWIFFKMQKTFTTNFKHIFFLNSSITKISKAICTKKTFEISWNNKLNNTNRIFNFWTAVDHRKSNGHQMLDCQWMFKYKINKHGELLKYKTRIIICDNQQH